MAMMSPIPIGFKNPTTGMVWDGTGWNFPSTVTTAASAGAPAPGTLPPNPSAPVPNSLAGMHFAPGTTFIDMANAGIPLTGLYASTNPGFQTNPYGNSANLPMGSGIDSFNQQVARLNEMQAAGIPAAAGEGLDFRFTALQPFGGGNPTMWSPGPTGTTFAGQSEAQFYNPNLDPLYAQPGSAYYAGNGPSDPSYQPWTSTGGYAGNIWAGQPMTLPGGAQGAGTVPNTGFGGGGWPNPIGSGNIGLGDSGSSASLGSLFNNPSSAYFSGGGSSSGGGGGGGLWSSAGGGFSGW